MLPWSSKLQLGDYSKNCIHRISVMKKYIILNVLAFILVCFLFFSSALSAAELKSGDQAPDLIGINTLDSSRFDLYQVKTQLRYKKNTEGEFIVGADGKYIGEFINQVVVLNFFSKTCLPCLREIPMFNRISDKYWNKDIVFLYVNIDQNVNVAEAKKLIKKLKIESPMILVNSKEAIRKYNTSKLPRLFIIDKAGNIKKIFKGFNDNLEFELSSVIDNLLKK